MSNTKPFAVHPNVIGKELVQQYGIKTVAALFNVYRARRGLEPVRPQTVKRYNGNGGWYTNNTPSLYRDFLISRLG